MSRALDVTTSLTSSVYRLGLGSRVVRLGARPELPLELYEFEACPFCRKVREVLSVLDLSAIVYPCPRGGERFRPTVRELGGKSQFPYLVDPNTGEEMYESDEITRYLFEKYGDREVPAVMRLGPLNDLGSALAGLPRLGAGRAMQPSHPPAEPLELYSFEASPYCRLVREALCSLQLPYRLHNVAKGSPSRDAFIKRSGKMQVPWLSDPNTGAELFESEHIVEYLRQTYALAS